ncbi:MAG: GIY-YIG nuclease family protein [Gemmatimonadales bacterium]
MYILASDSRELYVGVTGNLVKRVAQHRAHLKPDGYSAEHDTRHLVYCEPTEDAVAAIRREKQIKGWARQRKLELIETLNPDWKDLAEGW